MPRLPKKQAVMQSIPWALACGGVGLGVPTVMHGSVMATVIPAVIVGIAGAMATTADAGIGGLPPIIDKIHKMHDGRIKSKSDAKAARAAERRQAELVTAVLKHGKQDTALDLMKMEILREQLRTGRQLSEDTLRELLPHPRAQHENDPRGADTKLTVVQPLNPTASPESSIRRATPTQGLPPLFTLIDQMRCYFADCCAEQQSREDR